MARETRLTCDGSEAIVRLARPSFETLGGLIFRRYPELEWATFGRFGWRETPLGLVLTLVDVDPPRDGELDESVGHVAIQEPYSLRVALGLDSHPFGIGVIHSHPEGCRTNPSSIDDNMDRYYAGYFHDFAAGRPYVSLIFAEHGDGVHGTGRVHWRGKWHRVSEFLVDRDRVELDGERVQRSRARLGRVRRLASAFGDQAAERLACATVGVVGAGGTGSPAIEVLARAGVGRIIAVDPDCFSESNLERVHGSVEGDVALEPAKVAIVRRHVSSINPECELTLIRGRLPQAEVVDHLVHANVVLGCTDMQHSRLALTDLATRYLVPVLDCGVALEGSDGQVTGQVVQLLRILPNDPCVLCRELVSSVRLSQELMSEAERGQRMRAAEEARDRGENAAGYWRDEVQLNTVGYLTTTAGALAAAYAIGWITGRFDTPFTRLQMNIVAPEFDVTNVDVKARSSCPCCNIRGWADQGAADAFITPPSHWPKPVFL